MSFSVSEAMAFSGFTPDLMGEREEHGGSFDATQAEKLALGAVFLGIHVDVAGTTTRIGWMNVYSFL